MMSSCGLIGKLAQALNKHVSEEGGQISHRAEAINHA